MDVSVTLRSNWSNVICAISLFCFVVFFQGFESGRGRVVAVAYAEVTLLIYYCGAPPSGQLKVV